MFNTIKSWLSAKKGEPQRIHGDKIADFREISVAEIATYPNGLDDLLNRRIDGFLIRNVLSQEEVATLLQNFARISQDRLSSMPEGGIFPPVFAQVAQWKNTTRETYEKYFADCLQYKHDFEKDFGVNFEAKMNAIFTAMSGDREVMVPAGYDGNGSYAFATIRSLNNKAGNISIHCGNYFQTAFSKFYEHLTETTNVIDQLSYFVMLQTAETGGELTLYDIDWQDAQFKEDPKENNEIIGVNGNKIDVRDSAGRKKLYVNPQAGDMILFAGGQIWHRVERVRGNRSRITIGGFMGYSHDKKNICYWS